MVSSHTIDTSTSDYAVALSYQRKGFYAEGLYWAFYSNGTNAGWEFSADGETWSDSFTSIGAATGTRFSVTFDGVYVHYVRWSAFITYYRRGTPIDDGTITWSAAEQTVHSGDATDHYDFPSICVDTNGYVWIGAHHDQPDGDDFPIVVMTNNGDGTWTTDATEELSATDLTTWRVSVVALTDGKIYAVYCANSVTPRGKLYNSGWGAEESDVADYAIENGGFFSVTSIDDDVHFAYLRDVTYQIRHNVRVYGTGWTATDLLVQDSVTATTSPTISANQSADIIYCIWTNITTDHVYYKKWDAGWDASATDFVDESTDDIKGTNTISSFLIAYNDIVGVLYTTKLSSPYNVKIAFIEPDTITKTYTADVMLEALGVTKAYTTDVLLEYTDTKTYTVDTLLEATILSTYEADVLIEALKVTKTYTTDTLIEKLGDLKTYTTDSMIEAINVLKTYTADALLEVTDTETYTVDTLIEKLKDLETYTADALIEAINNTKTYTSDTLIEKTDDTEQYTTDTLLEKTDTKTYTVDVVLITIEYRYFTVHLPKTTQTITLPQTTQTVHLRGKPS